MTLPSSGQPPATVGLAPAGAYEVNSQVGLHLRDFTTIKERIHHDQEFLVATDLKVAPYFFDPDQETLIKSAISGLDSDLQAIDMTFIDRLTGLF
jgi:hypothetical protein